MSKLFSLEGFAAEFPEEPVVTKDDVFATVATDVEDFQGDMEVATERLTTACNDFNLVSGMSASMKGKKVASVDYFTSLENYRPVLETIAKNLGVKPHIPSLEDFQNPHGTQASHDIAMEGFFDYLKKIWDKIADIFFAFFKKISVFFRRLFNAELELDTYEEYVEGMIAKIKAKKMTVSDNKIVIDSKLPSLLANPGMEAVDSDFILTNGEGKIRQLVAVSNNVFQNSLSKLAKEELKDLYKALKTMIDDAGEANRSPDDVATELDKIRALSLNGLDQLFGYAINDLRKIPDTVYDALHHHFDRNELDDIRIHSLVDGGNYSEALPKNFNAYYALSENGKMYVSATTETDGYVQNKLHPISNANNLVRFYDFYKKVSKELNIKKIDGSIGEFQNRVDEIITLMKSRYVDLLEKLQKNKLNAKHGSRLQTKQEALNALILFFRDYDRRHPRSTNTNLLIMRSADTLAIDSSELELAVMNDNDPSRRDRILDSIADEDVFVVNARNILTTEGAPDQAFTSTEDLERVVKEYEALQKFLMNYLNSLQTMLKEVSVNLAGTFTELRFELIKYIYNSAKLYTA